MYKRSTYIIEPSHQGHHQNLLQQNLSPALPALGGGLPTVSTLSTSATMPPTAALSQPSIALPTSQNPTIGMVNTNNNTEKKIGKTKSFYYA